MEWLRTHPYTFAIGGAIALIIVGWFLVTSRSPVQPSQSSLTWNGGAQQYAYQSTGEEARPTPQEVAQDVVQNQAPATLTLPPLASSSPVTSFTPTAGTDDYVALLDQLVAPASASTKASTNTSGASSSQSQGDLAIAQAYQYIPTGLVAMTTSQPKMTSQQVAIYTYGNELGGEIQSFEDTNTNQAQVLKNQAEDRTDPVKAKAVIELGQGFVSIGTFMQQMQDVPSSASSMQAALAKSYVDIGQKLELVPKAQTDAAFAQAVETYDASADTFITNYVALAEYFSEQGVTFSTTDPGSIFMFSGSAGGL